MLIKKFLVVDCGYTSRLIRHYDDMEVKPILIYDDVLGSGLTRFNNVYDEELETILASGIRDLSGVIVFRLVDDEVKIADIIKMLQRFAHCAFFFIDRCYGECFDDGVERREIIDSDLDDFVENNDEYYYGTLYEVDHEEIDRNKIITLKFDTESG